MRIKGLLFSAGLVLSSTVYADVTVANLFTNNMVLQRERPVNVWGKADVGERVTVTLGTESASSDTGKDGAWLVTLAPRAAGGDLTLSVKGTTRTIELTNVTFGDVWLCGGQSNMDTRVAYYNTQFPDIVTTASFDAVNPDLRLFVVKHYAAAQPQDEFEKNNDKFGGDWRTSDKEANYKFSALGYYFGKNLQPEVGVPIGLIYSAVGGSMVRAWTPREIMSDSPLLRPFLDMVNDKTPDRHQPSLFYNGMIAPLHKFAIKGVVWYQGETDAGFTDYGKTHYSDLFATMISTWRARWHQPDMPFVYVVLAGFMDAKEGPDNPPYSTLRDEQLKTLTKVKNVAAISAMDLGQEKDIHPPFKIPLGERMSSAVLNLVYGRKDAHGSGPIVKSAQLSKDKKSILLTFDNVGSGLESTTVTLDKHVMSGDDLSGFEVCGSDGMFVKAKAKVKGKDKVELSFHRYVTDPKIVRYGWANFPLCNLYSAEGVPAFPFRQGVE